MKKLVIVLTTLLMLAVLIGAIGCAEEVATTPSPSPTPTVATTASPTATPTLPPLQTPTPNPTPTATLTPTVTSSSTPRPTPTLRAELIVLNHKIDRTLDGRSVIRGQAKNIGNYKIECAVLVISCSYWKSQNVQYTYQVFDHINNVEAGQIVDFEVTIDIYETIFDYEVECCGYWC